MAENILYVARINDKVFEARAYTKGEARALIKEQIKKELNLDKLPKGVTIGRVLEATTAIKPKINRPLIVEYTHLVRKFGMFSLQVSNFLYVNRENKTLLKRIKVLNRTGLRTFS